MHAAPFVLQQIGPKKGPALSKTRDQFGIHSGVTSGSTWERFVDNYQCNSGIRYGIAFRNTETYLRLHDPIGSIPGSTKGPQTELLLGCWHRFGSIPTVRAVRAGSVGLQLFGPFGPVRPVRAVRAGSRRLGSERIRFGLRNGSIPGPGMGLLRNPKRIRCGELWDQVWMTLGCICVTFDHVGVPFGIPYGSLRGHLRITLWLLTGHTGVTFGPRLHNWWVTFGITLGNFQVTFGSPVDNFCHFRITFGSQSHHPGATSGTLCDSFRITFG